MEELPMDLSNLGLAPSILLSGSAMRQRRELGEFRGIALLNRDLLDETRGSGWRDNGRVGLRSRIVVRGWRVTDDRGDALSSEPYFGCSSAVYYLVGVRIDELGIEEASRGEEQDPHRLGIGGLGHRGRRFGDGWVQVRP